MRFIFEVRTLEFLKKLKIDILPLIYVYFTIFIKYEMERNSC